MVRRGDVGSRDEVLNLVARLGKREGSMWCRRKKAKERKRKWKIRTCGNVVRKKS